MKTSVSLRRVCMAAGAAVGMLVVPAVNAHAFDSSDAVLTGLAVGALVAASHHDHDHGYRERYREVHYYAPRPRYCPPREVTVVHHYPRYDAGGYGYPSGYRSSGGYGYPDGYRQTGYGYPGAGYGGYQRNVQVNYW